MVAVFLVFPLAPIQCIHFCSLPILLCPRYHYYCTLQLHSSPLSQYGESHLIHQKEKYRRKFSMPRIHARHAESDGVFGSSRMFDELHYEGEVCSLKRVARLI